MVVREMVGVGVWQADFGGVGEEEREGDRLLVGHWEGELEKEEDTVEEGVCDKDTVEVPELVKVLDTDAEREAMEPVGLGVRVPPEGVESIEGVAMGVEELDMERERVGVGESVGERVGEEV